MRRVKARGHEPKMHKGMWRCMRCGMVSNGQQGLARWDENQCGNFLTDTQKEDPEWIAGKAVGHKHPRYVSKRTKQIKEEIQDKTTQTGHRIKWNEKLGSSYFESDAGWFRCEKCEEVWHMSYAGRSRNLGLILQKRECRQTPDYWRKQKALNLLSMRKWREVQTARKVTWGSHDVDYVEDHNLWKCKGCQKYGRNVMTKEFLSIMKEDCKPHSGSPQTTKSFALTDFGVTPASDKTERRDRQDWYDAKFIEAELERLGARKAVPTD